MLPHSRPSYFEAVDAEQRRTLPIHCDECRRISRQAAERVVRHRMMEDLAKAFAFVGLLGWLRGMGHNDFEIEWAMHRLGLYDGQDR